METDEALLERLSKGELAAFDRLYERHARPLFGFLRAQLGGDAEAEDVLHETFLALLRERGPADVRSFRAFLYQVARNLCRNRGRSRRRAGRALEAIVHEMPPPPPSAREELVRNERLATLSRAVEKLPPALAEVYRLRAGGLAYEEMARVLDVPIGTVKSRMSEMVKRLREEVS